MSSITNIDVVAHLMPDFSHNQTVSVLCMHASQEKEKKIKSMSMNLTMVDCKIQKTPF